jgi:flavorubredoxin
MARKIAEGITYNGLVEAELVDIENILLGDLEEKIVKCDALLLGSPTINQNTLLPVYKMFALINPIRDKGKLAAAFGSYGWSGEAVGIIEGQLRNLKLNVFCEGLSAKFFPFKGKDEAFVDFGRKFADELAKQEICTE